MTAPIAPIEPTGSSGSAATSAPVATTNPVDVGAAGFDAEALVRALADDALAGRDNLTTGARLARELLIEELSSVAVPVEGIPSFEQEFADGTNLVGVVPGSDLADEYVIVGAHYDHLGPEGCNGKTPADMICNGATDNATGVAAALAVVHSLAELQPRRSVVIALWDAEEDGLLGSAHYVAQPLVPLDRTVAYVNFDILGSDLLPSLADDTLLIGAETGGDVLAEAAIAAGAATSLDVAHVSVIFGQGRSDHASFQEAGVPVAFLADATNGCYHTVDDEIDRVDFAKLDEQIGLATALVTDLATADRAPTFDAEAPLVDFADVVELRALVSAGRDELVAIDPALSGLIDEFDRVAAAGPDAVTDDELFALLGGTAAVIDALASGPCA